MCLHFRPLLVSMKLNHFMNRLDRTVLSTAPLTLSQQKQAKHKNHNEITFIMKSTSTRIMAEISYAGSHTVAVKN